MAPRIEHYRFGLITIDGKSYQNDVVIWTGGVIPDWIRKEGHSLHPGDLESHLERARPERLIIGLGAYGAMKVPEPTRQWIEGMGIELSALPTDKACERYNELAASGAGVMAGLHLTC